MLNTTARPINVIFALICPNSLIPLRNRGTIWGIARERTDFMARPAILALIIATCAATPILAQNQQCAERDTVVDRLAEKYGESRQSIGMASQGRVMEVFASTDTGTWTITVTMPNGMTCLVASGQSFENIDEAPLPTGIKG